jgi:hypothetical protein
LLGDFGKTKDIGYRMQDTRCRMQDTGYRIQDAGCRMQDAGCRILDNLEIWLSKKHKIYYQ